MQQLTLKMARAKTKNSQGEMADKLGISRATYAAYESYQTAMRIDTALKFSEIVNVPMDELIFLKKNYT